MSILPALSGSLDALLPGDRLGPALAARLPALRWYAGKARALAALTVTPLAALPVGERTARLTVVGVRYLDGSREDYLLPLLTVPAGQPDAIPETALLALLHTPEGDAMLIDAVGDPAFAAALLDLIADERRVSGPGGMLIAGRDAPLPAGDLTPRLLGAEQSNSSIRYGDQLILKLYRRLMPGINPDVEVGRFLTARRFPATPAVRGWIEFRPAVGEPVSLAVLHDLIPDAEDGWTAALALIGRLVRCRAGEPAPAAPAGPLVPPPPLPSAIERALGSSLVFIRRLGVVTAELHLTLASAPDDPAFAPEPPAPAQQQAAAAALLDRWARLPTLLAGRSLPPAARAAADAVLAAGDRVAAILAAAPAPPLLTRCHGDFHLGQTLLRAGEPVIIDFEGEPARPLAERRAKRSPLRDVAGMLRSFDYAAAAAGAGSPWAEAWRAWASAAYLAAYLDRAHGAPFLPRSAAETAALLDLFLLEKALYEVEYELHSRPDWVAIPLAGLRRLLAGGRPAQ
ncbi:MAG: putative maltokinase [Chloroflexota bacterium]|nr:putative maltokinase [Chloroflexota bacterium]